MGLCLLRDRIPRKNTGLACVSASWGTENHVKNIVRNGFVPLKRPKTT